MSHQSTAGAQAGLGEVVRYDLRRGVRLGGEPLLQGTGDGGVELLAPSLEHRLVGGILHQRVLEGVDGLRRRAPTEDELGGDELVQSRKELLLRQGRRRGEEVVGKAAADARRDSAPPP